MDAIQVLLTLLFARLILPISMLLMIGEFTRRSQIAHLSNR